jgi:hypothetical protein
MISYKELSRKLKLRELGYSFNSLDPMIDFLDDVKKRSIVEKTFTDRYILLIDDVKVADIYYTRENYNLRIDFGDIYPLGEKLTKEFTKIYIPKDIKIYSGDQLMGFINNRTKFLQSYMTDHLIKPMLKKILGAEL